MGERKKQWLLLRCYVNSIVGCYLKLKYFVYYGTMPITSSDHSIKIYPSYNWKITAISSVNYNCFRVRTKWFD